MPFIIAQKSTSTKDEFGKGNALEKDTEEISNNGNSDDNNSIEDEINRNNTQANNSTMSLVELQLKVTNKQFMENSWKVHGRYTYPYILL